MFLCSQWTLQSRYLSDILLSRHTYMKRRDQHIRIVWSTICLRTTRSRVLRPVLDPQLRNFIWSRHTFGDRRPDLLQWPVLFFISGGPTVYAAFRISKCGNFLYPKLLVSCASKGDSSILEPEFTFSVVYWTDEGRFPSFWYCFGAPHFQI